jgi:SAM-dependent methyltransferase
METESLETCFSEIYAHNQWGFQSGVGSLPINALEYSTFIQNFMARNQVRTVVDYGCGSWQFSRFIDWTAVNYLGLDVVPALIDHHNKNFAQPNISFKQYAWNDDIPTGDLLLCKDVLQHLPNTMVATLLDRFRQRFKFMLITNDDAPVEYRNQDTHIGGWRTLRLEQAPFFQQAAVVLEWVVLAGSGWTRKATYLLYGSPSPSSS